MMNEGNITVTLTESQHELINEILHHALDTFQLVAPYDDGLYDIPMENPIIQRYTMIENLREMFYELWADRFTSES
jgi:hypothetical protein